MVAFSPISNTLIAVGALVFAVGANDGVSVGDDDGSLVGVVLG